jgi:hypothetical protein
MVKKKKPEVELLAWKKRTKTERVSQRFRVYKEAIAPGREKVVLRIDEITEAKATVAEKKNWSETMEEEYGPIGEDGFYECDESTIRIGLNPDEVNDFIQALDIAKNTPEILEHFDLIRTMLFNAV